MYTWCWVWYIILSARTKVIEKKLGVCMGLTLNGHGTGTVASIPGIKIIFYTMYGSAPNHLYFAPLAVLDLVDMFFGTKLLRSTCTQTSKSVSRKCLSLHVRPVISGIRPNQCFNRHLYKVDMYPEKVFSS